MLDRLKQSLGLQTAAVAREEEPPARQNILIISNCQVQLLKHCLSAVCENADFDTIPVHVYTPDEREKVFSEVIASRDHYDLVLSIALSDDFGALSRDAIAATFHPVPVITISNLVFTGLHPDITYIGGLSARTPGPLGDYHSRLALLGYLMGLEPAQTEKLYRAEVYHQLGYFNAFQESLEEMRRRDETTDIPIGSLLEERLRLGVCFFSHNHPTSFLMAPYVGKIARTLHERGLIRYTGFEPRPEEVLNFLAASWIFPVYPELTQEHSLPYKGSYIYRTETVGDHPSSVITLSDFVRAEYDAFAQGDQAQLRTTYPGVLLLLQHGEREEFRRLISRLLK
ncbi:WcbI family polysaccharide biosynthesis putative acetyltransferase [Asticcacaulis sp. BYS171W]|uniref:WcbI family polysaccharide biosynthesis putative acetyltransferase n=1 Tax=Asticcacaulis aquaticus TaxID=2984212 RepID=A0ABT5HTQ7_9CAUL|nr:WcbI family polysaccharide biosynthesis putative acetyltransferase [Asticcacaulis aquaticus]MDC7682866.1 WcbI family polysaccharide biosynthesis putative acetyltransferase [Asticcacaulis aquaticus]